MFGQISFKHQLKTCALSKPNILEEDPHAKGKPISLLVLGAEEPMSHEHHEYHLDAGYDMDSW